METKEEKRDVRKKNMKLFPIYKALGWDYLFHYTIDFLFFTQVKNMSASIVILKDAFFSFFNIILQIPANIIVEMLGRRNSIILSNILNCTYMVIIMFSKNLGDLVFAEFISAMAFSIKGIAEPSLLGLSIPPSKYKSKIYASLNSKGLSGYYILDAISKIIAGFLFAINGYLPLICSLVILVLVAIISIGFVEPVKKKKVTTKNILDEEGIRNVRDGFIYVLNSERLKALILCGAVIATIIKVSTSYHVSLLEELNISSEIIGIIAAVAGIMSACASKKQDWFHRKFRNKSLITLAYILSISICIAGISGIISKKYIAFIAIVILTNLTYNCAKGIYYTIVDKYLSNFANDKIDTKIFAASNLITNFAKTIGSLFASFLIDKMATAYCMIVMGVIFTIINTIMKKYMKTRVGLKPEEYSKEEIKYDEQKK